MSDDATEILAVTLVGGLMLAVLLGLAYWANSAECTNQWERSGFQSDYGFVQGCLISKDGKTWIPAANYREIQ